MSKNPQEQWAANLHRKSKHLPPLTEYVSPRAEDLPAARAQRARKLAELRRRAERHEELFAEEPS